MGHLIKATVVAITLAAAAAAGFGAHAAETFRSEELKFEVLFPSAPKQQSKTHNTVAGKARMFRFKAGGKELSPAMSVTVYSRGPFSKQEVATGLEMSGVQQAQRFKGTFVSRKDLELNGFAGKETVIEGVFQGRKFFYRAQTFYVGNRQYILSVLGGSLKDVSAPADVYFKSLKLWK